MYAVLGSLTEPSTSFLPVKSQPGLVLQDDQRKGQGYRIYSLSLISKTWSLPFPTQHIPEDTGN